jgi:hypothetical protein
MTRTAVSRVVNGKAGTSIEMAIRRLRAFFREAWVLAPRSGNPASEFHHLGPSGHSLYWLTVKMSSAAGQIIFGSRLTIFI